MRFIIDGYNLIFSRRRPGRPLRQMNIEAARESLLSLLSRYRAVTGDTLVVFFDGSREATGFLRRERVNGVDIVFSYPDATADEEIKAHVEEIKARSGVYVVSSDNSLKTFARRCGLQVIDSQVFMAQVRRALGRRHERSGADEPVEKYQGPSRADVEYWLKVFTAPETKRGERA